jgi:hypothetical protein
MGATRPVGAGAHHHLCSSGTTGCYGEEGTAQIASVNTTEALHPRNTHAHQMWGPEPCHGQAIMLGYTSTLCTWRAHAVQQATTSTQTPQPQNNTDSMLQILNE